MWGPSREGPLFPLYALRVQPMRTRTTDSQAEAQKVFKTITRRAKNEDMVDDHNSRLFIPTSSTLLDLACSEHIFGGYAAGKMVNIIGDSSSGKTFLALSMFAEMTKHPRFDDYTFIYDDTEAASEFDMVYLFGQQTAERIKSPHVDENGDPCSSATVQDFLSAFLNRIHTGHPFVYVLDSWDALTSDEEMDKVSKLVKARKSGEKISGSMGMERAKASSQFFRMLVREIKRTQSLLVVVSQIRDNANQFAFAEKYVAGGRALKFYASYRIFVAPVEKLRHNKEQIGIMCQAVLRKNKVTGKSRKVEFPIYYDYGVDDIGSSIDFLLSHGHWRKSGTKIKADGISGKPMTRAALISHIENEDKEKDLKRIVGGVWMKVERALRLHRKRRFK